MLASVAAGVAFGLALAAPPGPMNAVIAEEAVQRGWRKGVRAGLGAATADFCFFVLALVGVVAVVTDLPLLHAGLLAVGGGLMLYFAYGAYRGVSESFREAGERRVAGTGFQRAFVLAITNPYQLAFWLSAGVALVEPGELDLLSYTPYLGDSLAGALVVHTGSPALVAGFFAGVLAWVVSFPLALAAAERRVESLAPTVSALSAILLAGFGVLFLADAVRTIA
ncbi:LysE family translocator [Salarchaeum japonicum]|uniref:LysE family translocator n=1 Tax=Salarchaeum japonicum TaxID=555573 RepID=UPI003C717362